MTLWSFEPHHLATLVLLGLAVVIVWAIGGGVRVKLGPKLRRLR